MEPKCLSVSVGRIEVIAPSHIIERQMLIKYNQGAVSKDHSKVTIIRI